MKQTQNSSRTRLKKSILAGIIIVPFVPFILAIGVSFYFFMTELEHLTIQRMDRIVCDHRMMIESFLSERLADLEFITQMHQLAQIDDKMIVDTLLDNLRKRSSAFIDLGVFDNNGIHLVYSGPYALEGKKYTDAPWFKQVMETGCYISDVFLGYRNSPHFVIAVRKMDENSTWVLRATIDTLFFDRLVSGVRLGRTGEAYILNKAGAVQTANRSDGIRILENDPDIDKFLPVNGIRTLSLTDSKQTKYLCTTTWLKNRQWLLIVRQEKKDAYQSLYSAFVLSLLIMITGGAVIIVLAFWLTDRIIKNMDQLGMEKESLGHQLIRATQLAEIGEMATGFAHEINNPLQIIKSEQSLIEVLLEDLSDDSQNMDDINASLSQIRLQVDRCAQITHSILKFGRENKVQPERVMPVKIIPEIVRLVEEKARVNSIEIRKNIPEDIRGFMADPSQFQQVMLNLLNNAMDAVAEKHGSEGGMVHVTAQNKGSDRIEIRVADNGSGIEQKNIDKVFSPFFTTKPVGKGTGLGLSVCYGIVENFGGSMTVASSLQTGTVFSIELPAAIQLNISEVENGKNETDAG